MKNFLPLLVLSLFSLLCSGQGGMWTWLSGDSVQGSSGVFGTQGVPSVNNHPPGLYEAAEWKDKQGNFWVYGGWDNAGGESWSDLWKFNPSTYEWTWVKGNGLQNQSPIYGTQGVPGAGNTPGMRSFAAASWVDTSGNMWLFGGSGNADDLWKYEVSLNQWTWVKGSKIVSTNSVHGVMGVPSLSNTPGSREETCSAWTDSLNNLWLFGGGGIDDNGSSGDFNDLMKYNIASNEWTWMKGSAFVSASPYYGIKGVAGTSNEPGPRSSYAKWKDTEGNFWLMGGYGEGAFNDMWKYDLDMNEWTWIYGTDVSDDSGRYTVNCIFDTLLLPISRDELRASVTDDCGRFWLFGGRSFSPLGYLNDLWVFDPELLKWNWITGTSAVNQSGANGMLGVASALNMPASRKGAVAWWGNDGRYYMFGGEGPTEACSDVWVFNPDTNCISVSSCAAVVSPRPVASFQSTTIICANGCINFTNNSINATSWQWIFAGASDSTSTAQNPQGVCYLTPGIYNVTLVASNASGSDTLRLTNYITVSAAPPVPAIKQMHNDTLFCSTNAAYTSYQWYFDTTIIAGATNSYFVISKSGNYNVEVTNEDGCKISEGINIILGVQNYTSNHAISLFPNPATERLIIQNEELRRGKIEIYNLLGQMVSKSEMINPKSEIDVSMLPSGMYFLRVTNQSGSWTGKFVKE